MKTVTVNLRTTDSGKVVAAKVAARITGDRKGYTLAERLSRALARRAQLQRDLDTLVAHLEFVRRRLRGCDDTIWKLQRRIK